MSKEEKKVLRLKKILYVTGMVARTRCTGNARGGPRLVGVTAQVSQEKKQLRDSRPRTLFRAKRERKKGLCF